MTSYTIAIGYNSAKRTSEVGQFLQDRLAELRKAPELIACEAHRLDTHLAISDLLLYAEAYRETRADRTVRISKGPADAIAIQQLASGGGSDRRLKESLRRAMCRLLLEQCHAHQMEVSIVVA